MRLGRRAWIGIAALLALAAAPALADWLAPDASLRDAQMQLRYATRDTVGHGDDLAKLDTLGVALLRIGRVAEARKLFDRVLAAKPGDVTATASIGKLALWADRTAQAESLLAGVGDVENARQDLYATRLRRGDWTGAASLAEEMGDEGRKPLLEHLATVSPLRVSGERASLLFEKTWPAPLIEVRLNGATVLMLVDTGTPGLLIDRQTARAQRVRTIGGQRLTSWDGTRVAIRNAMVQKLQIGDVTIEDVPAGVLSLHQLSLQIQPAATPISGVIGMSVLKRFDVTFDYGKRRFELAPIGTAAAISGTRVPFEQWGEDELTVWGSIQGGRRMAMVLATGMPGGGFGAPDVVFEEHGLKSGGVSKLVKGAGTWLQGRPWSQVNVPSLTIGNQVYDRVPGWAGAMEPVEMWRHGVRRDALLGPGILLRQRTTIDWKRRDLVFEEP
jgi:hypothetical protein